MVGPFLAMYAGIMASQATESGRAIGGAQLICLEMESGRFAFFAWHNVVIIVWPTAATGLAVERLGSQVRELLKQHPNGESHVHVVKAGAPLPTAEARAGFVRLMHEFEHALAAAAVCLLGSGFWASAIQGAVTGMRMLAPHSFDMHIHNDLESVVEWLPEVHRKCTGVALSPDDLLTVLREAFAEGTKSTNRSSERAAAGVR
jgi:hypothetical protein